MKKKLHSKQTTREGGKTKFHLSAFRRGPYKNVLKNWVQGWYHEEIFYGKLIHYTYKFFLICFLMIEDIKHLIYLIEMIRNIGGETLFVN